MSNFYPASDQHYEKSERINLCACLGEIYGEPYCPCMMARKGLPMSIKHVEENKKAEADMDKAFFGPGGIFARRS